MKRRDFITLLGGAVAAWPLAAHAQQAEKLRAIGYLNPGSGPPAPGITALFDALAELGWIEGKNVVFERRYAENRLERLPELAAELVRLNVDVIVAIGTPGRSRPSGPPRPFQSSWQPPATRWGAGSSPVWRGPAATSRE